MGVVATAGCVAGLGVGATFAYDYLTGRNLVRDNLDRLRLSARSLSQWDAYCAQRAPANDLLVCLTTTPSRVHTLGPTLTSLLAQCSRPARIRLHLPEVSKRERRRYDVPDFLSRLQCVEVVRTEDVGPATKLLPALRTESSDQPILVVDDDKLYPPDFVGHFAAAMAQTPGVAWGSSGWIVPEDLTDRPTTLRSNLLMLPPVPTKATRIRAPKQVDVLQGYSGYLVRPRFFDLERVFDYSQAPEAAFFVDDVWISAHLRVPKYVLPSDRYCFEVLRHRGLNARTSISLHNRGGGDPSLRHNTIMIRHLKHAWLGSDGTRGTLLEQRL